PWCAPRDPQRRCPMTPRSWIPTLFARTTRPVSARRRTRPRVRLGLEALEDRLAPATFTVHNLNDSGAGSLRQAIHHANSAAGLDLSNFQPGLTGTTPLTSAELHVTDDLTVQGPGANVLTVSGNSRSWGVFNLDAGGTHNFSFSGLTIADGKVENSYGFG